MIRDESESTLWILSRFAGSKVSPSRARRQTFIIAMFNFSRVSLTENP